MTELHQQHDRAASFGTVAATYDDVRPTYPDALLDDLLQNLPRDVLDVGCGTGIAARLFAARGCVVLGVEPDADMAAVARERGTDVEVSSFEQWDDAGRRFDLLVSGQAWHWVEPDAGAAKAAQVLRPGARIGLFWNTDEMRSDRAGLDAAYERIAPELRNRTYGGRRAPRTSTVEALQRAGFTGVEQRDYAWARHYEPDDYVRLVSTFSDHILLPAGQRDELFAAVAEVAAAAGGFDVDYECQLVTGVAP